MLASRLTSASCHKEAAAGQGMLLVAVLALVLTVLFGAVAPF